jgi:hypothetical protein
LGMRTTLGVPPPGSLGVEFALTPSPVAVPVLARMAHPQTPREKCSGVYVVNSSYK